MSLDWETLDDLGLRHAFGAVADVLVAATEQERLAFGAQIESRAAAERTGDWVRYGRDPGPMHVLALACMPSAARAAELLCRSRLRAGWGMATAHHADPVVRIVRARPVPWWGELGFRLAEQLPASGAGYTLPAALLREAGVAPPVTEGVVRGWLRTLFRPPFSAVRAPLSARLRDSPHLDLLLPAVFDIDGLGSALTEGTWDKATRTMDRTPAFPGAVAELVADGRLDRTQILDATVDRLVRGDRPAWLRPFTVLHEALAPTVDETARHVLDHARLLSGAPSPIAGLAQRALRTMDDAGRLDRQILLEAGRHTLVRPEKALVKAQLGWLEAVVRRDPGRAGEVLETVAAAFGHPVPEIQERALTLIGRHIRGLDAVTTARLAAATTPLTGDLATRAATLFGVAPEPTPALVPTRPAALPPAAMPSPIADAAELAVEVVALLRDPSALRWERVLAGLVALTAAGRRHDLAAALKPVLARHAGLSINAWGRPSSIGFLGAAIQAVLDPDRRDQVRAPMIEFVQAARRDGGSALPGTTDGVLSLRIAEIAMRMPVAPVQLLVSTPTQVNGSLTADVLLERLLRAEAEGWQPWPLDVEQALLRVPREVPGEVLTRAARLTSPMGRQVAKLLATGLPEPISTRFEQRPGSEPDKPGYGPCPVARRVVVNVRPGRTDGLFLETSLFTLTRRPSPAYLADDFDRQTDLLAMVLPQHREVTAAWVLSDLASLADLNARGGAALLPWLAECAGPVGPAMALALAYALGARHEPDRVAATDAFIMLAAGDEPFAAAVGAQLGDLCGDGTVKLSRVVPALGEAHLAGASAAVWELLTTALPLLLLAAPRGLPDLLVLATQVAGAVGAKEEIPGLREAAGGAGGARLVKEAKRLQATIDG